MESVRRIELPSPAWKAGVLPLNYADMVGKVRFELTQAHRPTVLQTATALQLCRFPIKTSQKNPSTRN